MERATIHDFSRASEIILKWCEEHPIKTRQSEFMKMFPNVGTYKGVITICPCLIDCNYERKHCKNYVDFDCTDCKKRLLACGGR